MIREALDSLDKETLIRLVMTQAETIAALTRECEALRARVAELEAKLALPPKTPDNSSTPPSQGRKASAASAGNPKGKPHPGAQRPQIACEAYDHIEIPEIKPDVTRVTRFGGTCPCCAKKFTAPAPQGLEQGSPPEPVEGRAEPAGVGHRSALHARRRLRAAGAAPV